MGDGKWLRHSRGGIWGDKRSKRKRGRKQRPGAGAPFHTSLAFEALEDRRLLATIVVTNASDLDNNGNVVFGSLRYCINLANSTQGGDTIIFADSLFPNGSPATIGLDGRNLTNSGQLAITQPLTILGPGPGQLTIAQGRANQRIFDLNIGSDDEIFSVEISGVTLTGGNLVGFTDTQRGGAIFSRESLRMVETVVTGNSADDGGGGIFISRGRLTLDRSLIQNNSAGVGGGIMHGGSDDDHAPGLSTISNSTITGNAAFGIPNSDTYLGAWGGGIFNRNGKLQIINSTITGNSGSDGAGVASFGNPVADDPKAMPLVVPPPTVFTYVGNSIISGNDMSDADRVGMTTDDPPRDLYPSFFGKPVVISSSMPTPAGSLGHNIVGTGNTTTAMSMPMPPAMPGPNLDFAFKGPGDMVGVDPMFISDMNGNPILKDYGGSTPVFLLDPASPAVDMGDPMIVVGNFDQRGRHFTREFDYTGTGMDTPDIGAVELQQGVFVVDVLKDDFDKQFSKVWRNLGTVANPSFDTSQPYESEGDFSLREAIDFARKNPEADTILFSESLRTAETPGPVPNPPTITLNQGLLNGVPGSDGVLIVDGPLQILGPSDFILEVDASGNDPTPTQNEGNGSRVFLIDDGSTANQSAVTITNLTIMGADQFGVGGGIYNREDLTLQNVTFKDDNATDDAGALYVAAGKVTIDSSTFNNNRAGDDGGALYIDTLPGGTQPDVTIINSTFSANTAGDRGGAIDNNTGKVHISYSTITLNNASGLRGSGVWNGTAGTLTEFLSTIVSGNSNNVDVEYATGAASTIVSLGYNLVGGGVASPATIASGRFTAAGDKPRIFNPMLGPLINTGGLTQTHSPLAGSPVIDAGDPNALPGNPMSVPIFDQRGPDFTRVFDGDLDGAARIDIGAYELQSSVFMVSSSTDENDGNYSQGNLSLREAIQLANGNPLPDEITFDPMIVGQDVIWSLGGALSPNTTQDMKITSDLTITGPGSTNLALDGTALIDPGTGLGRRMFTIDDNNPAHPVNVVITGLSLINTRSQSTGGVAQQGGAIFSRENLTLDDVALVNNGTIGAGMSGGSIYIEKPAGAPLSQDVQLKISNSLITGSATNGSNADGGAIYAKDAGVVIDSYTSISGNSTTQTQGDGGGIYIKSTITSSAANFNLDTAVDGLDFLRWQRNFGLGGANKSEGDANGDAVNNALDFNVWKSQFGTVGNQGGTLAISQASVTGNSTAAGDADGGGIFSDSGEVLLEDAVISGNQTVGSNSEGGGIVAKNSNVFLTRTTVSLNKTLGNQSPGGGIYIITTSAPSSTVSLVDSVVEQNTTSGQSSSGGGIAIQNGTAVMQNTSVRENRVTGLNSNGGGLANLSGNLVVRDSTVANNQATNATSGKGGGIYSDTNLLGTQSTLILNSTVSGNTGQFRGGGVFNADGLTDIQHSTITNNATTFFNLGAGVASQGNSSTQTRVRSSIIAGNVGAAAGTQSDLDFVDGGTNSFLSQGYNLLGSGNALAAFSAAGGNITGVTNPTLVGLAPLADNGGQNMPLGNPETHALLATSLAVNGGSPAFDANAYSPALLYDERGAGFARVAKGRIDIGAFESTFSVLAALAPDGVSATAGALRIDVQALPVLNTPAPSASLDDAEALPGLVALDGTSEVAAPSEAAQFQAAHRRWSEPGHVNLRHKLAVFADWDGMSIDGSPIVHAARARRKGKNSDADRVAPADAAFASMLDDDAP